MAAIRRDTYKSIIFKYPGPASAPAAKRSESPGRNGIITRPVSAKIIPKSRRYVSGPKVLIIEAR